MDTNWAADHLQTIRTLMERSALYRRALAPIMIVVGSVGLAAAVVPRFTPIESNRTFALYWLSVSLAALVASFLLVRRQALKDAEPFWSLPTRRVTQALAPPFLVGFVSGTYPLFQDEPRSAWLLGLIWIVSYGCALHAAGFFMQRGIKLFGWVFIGGGCVALLGSALWPRLHTTDAAHCLMGFFFGFLHLSYGGYLYFTERRRATP
jgi:hypothetical protein